MNDVKDFMEPMLTGLFQLIEAGETPEKVAENDYLMKTIMRIIYIGKKDMTPYVSNLLVHLTQILSTISKNPSNPKFNHYVFESIGSLVRFLCSSDPKLVVDFESCLFPPMQTILASDIQEFTPYVFQIIAQLLEFQGGVGSGIPEIYKPMLPPILMPALWENHGN